MILRKFHITRYNPFIFLTLTVFWLNPESAGYECSARIWSGGESGKFETLQEGIRIVSSVCESKTLLILNCETALFLGHKNSNHAETFSLVWGNWRRFLSTSELPDSFYSFIKTVKTNRQLWKKIEILRRLGGKKLRLREAKYKTARHPVQFSWNFARH